MSEPKRVSRMARTLRSLLLMGALGAGLAVYNVYANARDVRVATGPATPEQRAFFVAAAERPDIAVFFKNLRPSQRLKMARNIGEHSAPELPKLIGKCLGTFDANARQALTQSLAELALEHPKQVAEQLSVAGSFQQLAVATALRAAGPGVLPIVAERLTDGGARPNAVAYLVGAGPESIPPLLPMLQHKEKDVRLAAADALGKLRAREAVEPLTRMYAASQGDEKFGYLAAIAGIGDRRSEGLLEEALRFEGLPIPQRAQAALGLGRIGSDEGVATLWEFARHQNQELRQSSISALQITGDKALRYAAADPMDLLRVASGVRTPLADSLIREALRKPETLVSAAEAAHDRESVVAELDAALRRIDAERQGDVADALVQALASTEQGLAALRRLPREGALAGIVQRRLLLRSAS